LLIALASSSKKWFDLLGRFESLGGVAQNVYQREGSNGRGIFPVDPSCCSRILVPRNLLIERKFVEFRDGAFVIDQRSDVPQKEKIFFEDYYNELSWGNNGSRDSLAFLEFIKSLSAEIKDSLRSFKFIDERLLQYRGLSSQVQERFIDERVVQFDSKSVLAPMWELVNHSSFSAPFRITPGGLETPPLDCSGEEVLFKYQGMYSPMAAWRKYGFAPKCILAYSIPFQVKVSEFGIQLSCLGSQLWDLDSSKRVVVCSEGRSVTVSALPIGCISPALVLSNLASVFACFGASQQILRKYYEKICEINLSARFKMLNGLQADSELVKSLKYEIDLIKNSSCGFTI